MDEPAAAPLVGREVATTEDGRDITRGYVSQLHYLQPQDKLLRSLGGGGWSYAGYRLYQELLQDDRVHAAFAQRRSAVVARETEVVPGGTMRRDRVAAGFVEEMLDEVRWDAVTDRMLYGIHYGFSVAECLWARDGRHVTAERIAVRNRRRFVFGADFRPRLLTYDSPDGEELPPRKFWHFATGADNDDEPYGLGLGHQLYWPVWFKKNQTKFWLTALERFGAPTPVGKYQRGATESERKKLLEAVRAVHTDSGVTIPEDMMIDLLQATRSGSIDYDAFHRRMQDVITMTILSQTMTSEDGSSLAQAEVHMDVRKEIVEADAHLVCDSFNRQVVEWLCAWNFPDAARPRVARVMDEPPDTGELSERDLRIHQMGYRPSKDYVERAYNIDVDDAPAAPAPAAEDDDAAEFAEPSDDDMAAALDAFSAGGWAAVAEPLVRPVLRLAAADPESFAARLADAYPDMDDDAIEETLARALFAADLLGRAEPAADDA